MKTSEYEIMHRLEKTHWWFLGKQFLARNQFESLVFKGEKTARLLDIGCGTGMILQHLKQIGKAYGIEISPLAIQLLKERGISSVVRADANQPLPFSKETFSVITCLDVLEHLDHDQSLLREISRVCEFGGYVLLTVPAFDLFWSAHDTALRHKRRYTRKQLLKKLEKLPLEPIKTSYYNTVLSLPILIIRLFKRNISKRKEARSDFYLELPSFLNKALYCIFIAEIFCLKFFNFPFGVSILCILKKVSTCESGNRV